MNYSDPTLYLTLATAGMLLSAFLITSRMRLNSFVGLFRIQSLCLGAYACILAYVLGEYDLIVMACLILSLKAWVLPYVLLRTVEESHAAARLEAYFRPTILSLIGAVTIAFAFIVVSHILPTIGDGIFIVGTAVSLLLVGFSLLVFRGDLYGQSIGFLVMENGIFTLGLTLVGGMPLFVEVGIFFDVLVSFIIMVALAYRVQSEHVSVETDRLRELVG
jgi:hydrogenase-4 component E